MKKNNWIIVAIFSILAMIAIRSNGSPHIYLGLIFAYIAIFLAATFIEEKQAFLMGNLTIALGLILRKVYPVKSKLTGEKLENFLIKEAAYNEFLWKYFLLLIIGGGLVALLASKIASNIRSRKYEGISVNRLTYMAVFVAIGVIINSLRVGEVSFGGFPIILSGYLMGPLAGFIVGGVTDVVAFIVRPSAFGFNPIFTLTSALTGLLPILVTSILGESYPKFSFVKVLIGILVGQFLTSILIVPVFSTLLYGQASFLVLALKALIKQAISVPIYAFLVTSLNDRFSKVINFKKIL